MKPLKNPPSSVLPKTAAVLLRKLIRTIAKQPKNILGLLLFNYLNQTKKPFLFSQTVHCGYLKSFSPFRDIIITSMLTGSAPLLLFSYLTAISKPNTIAETEKKKSQNSLQNFSHKRSLRPSSQEDFLILLPEFLVNGSYMDPNCSSSYSCITSNFMV